MSVHLGAKKGEIADRVLLPGDPLRAKFVAEHFLDEAYCYNEVRGMYGYTGLYKGLPISVQGTGMGNPSMSIYATELINDYGAKKLIRIGTCGAMQKELNIRDIILAQAVSSDSNLTEKIFYGCNYAPTADFSLLMKAYQQAQSKKVNVFVGNIYNSDEFYRETLDKLHKFMDFGVLAVEMESTALYTLAAKYGVKALSILTVGSQLLTNERLTHKESEQSFNEMVEIALNTVIDE
ncbi:purine-nucleoside phosphorylase [Scopulibacillus darangshiensis]|uniref:Purine nucleoside phosphorylase DeoD-type n=1 Tax=Scopulibacillus darangshiensis TaxID=442528 RepID=A0A4R2NC70_9BACL|nr:purine-nucleoside phosphorylase [Scopulibacillus darangshiensis]TCP18733.1 purine-nucleoside phosphorylase [Scopulibacillus darangshiensis]